jgi:hypothetical protein
MTGRGAGACAGYGAPGYANRIPGRGFGAGWGRGRGWRNRYHATGLPGWASFGCAPAWGAPPAQPPTREQELEFLQAQAEGLQQGLDAINQRVAELEEKE